MSADRRDSDSGGSLSLRRFPNEPEPNGLLNLACAGAVFLLAGRHYARRWFDTGGASRAELKE